MELGQVGVVEGLVSENTIDREEFVGFEGFFVGDHFEVLGGDGSGVCSEDVFVGLFRFPFVVVSSATEPSFLVDVLDGLKVLLVLYFGCFRVGDEEGVVGVAGRMGLRLEEGIEIPEGAFDVTVGFHFFETHFEEDLDELLFGFHEQVQVAVFDFETFGCGVESFEFLFFPGVVGEHCAS